MTHVRIKYTFIFLFFSIYNLCSQPKQFQSERTKPSSEFSQGITVEHFSTEQGLSSRSVNVITQDKYGFIWIGTDNGLNKYDGENITVFKNIPQDSTSLCDNWVSALWIDSMGDLWIGTADGLNKYDPEINSFLRYVHNANDPNTLSNNSVQSIYEDKKGTLWIGTSYGLNKFDKNTKTCERIFPIPHDSSNSGINSITAILEDSRGDFWIGRGRYFGFAGGLSVLDRKNGIFTHFNHNDKDHNSLPNDWVTSLYEDRDGIVWIGTDGGVSTFNRTNNTFLPIQISSTKPLTIHRIFAKTICEDRTGNIWFATWGSGIFKYNKETKLIVQYTYDPLNQLSITSPTIASLFFDRSGLLWVGTWRGGVNTVALKPFVHHQTIANSFLLNNGAESLCKNHRGDLYIGTFLNGVWKYSFSTQELLHISLPLIRDAMQLASVKSNQVSIVERSDARFIDQIQEGNAGAIWMRCGDRGELIQYYPNSNKSSIVFRTPITKSGFREHLSCFLPDSDGIIWIGSRRTLYHIDTQGNVLSIFSSDPKNSRWLGSGVVNTLLRDRSGTFWIGMTSGLYQFEETSRSFIKFQYMKNDSTTLSNNVVANLLEDHRGRLWVGTVDGLNLYESTTGSFTRFTTAEGMAGKAIMSFQEDGKGNIWAATEVGITQINGTTGVITNYNQSSGLPTVEYFYNSSIRRENGELLFGTNTGILAFHPDNVKKLEYVPPVVITGIKKFNRPIQLTTSPELINEIIFKYDENVFSISFSALSYEKYSFNQYAYKLDGFDDDWVYCGSRREAIYTNLDPGRYTFRVIGSNHDNVWNGKSATLSIIVLAPWYQQWWAYCIYTLVFLGMVVSVNWVRMNRFRLEQQVLVEHLQTEKLSEMNSMKSRFLANVSHELRTPLSLILGPIEFLLLKKNDTECVEQLGIVQRNAQRLLRLIELLLQYSRLESGTIKLNVAQEDVISILRRLTGYFSSPAAKKQIEMRFTAEQENINGLVDAEKIEHILQNCISNAIKFTRPGGTVEVYVRIEHNDLIFSVKDTGVGIAPEHLHHVFERFYRVDTTHKTEGTGIGLSLSKELAEIHHGEMHIESEFGKGTTVTVRIPLSGYSDSEITAKSIEGSVKQEPIHVSSSNGVMESLVDAEEQPVILIAEDNEDARMFIRTQLTKQYTILEAEDGVDALNKTKFQIPDLVISDVMMPKKNGRELCKELKQDERTSHIPVILLTALAEKEDKIEGLNVGADDYLVKPFDAQELLSRVRNLLENRKKLREAFGRTVSLKPGEVSVTSLTDSFLQKSISVVNKHLSDPAFGAETFAQEVFLSRTQLHRKLKAITNLSATDFIRHLRLQRAKELLEKNAGTVSEISENVGFINHSYFAKCFHDQFGILPNEVRHPQK
ncbi:MAG: two-component regulator propeller domain-containing protein [Bacteroidota bacterium]|nr:two-component regulator propeller domain-containing protein [Bacteroidota bacterium]